MSGPWPIDGGYVMREFDGQDAVTAEDVVAFWLREGVMAPGEAERRLAEVHLVVTTEDGELVAVTSAFLRHHEQLGCEMWFHRGMIAAAHRGSGIGWHLGPRSQEVLEERFVSGADTRAPGIVHVIQNRGLMRHFNTGYSALDTVFIGENEQGEHVRVHWFPGALAPPPLQGSA
jgi:hypothetical protein